MGSRNQRQRGQGSLWPHAFWMSQGRVGDSVTRLSAHDFWGLGPRPPPLTLANVYLGRTRPRQEQVSHLMAPPQVRVGWVGSDP